MKTYFSPVSPCTFAIPASIFTGIFFYSRCFLQCPANSCLLWNTRGVAHFQQVYCFCSVSNLKLVRSITLAKKCPRESCITSIFFFLVNTFFPRFKKGFGDFGGLKQRRRQDGTQLRHFGRNYIPWALTNMIISLDKFHFFRLIKSYLAKSMDGKA